MTNFTGYLVNYHFITLNYLTTKSSCTCLNYRNSTAFHKQDNWHLPCSVAIKLQLFKTLSMVLVHWHVLQTKHCSLHSLSHTKQTTSAWHTQHAAINFHMCTHFQYAMHCTPKFNHSTFFYNYSLVYLLLFHLLQFRLLSFRLLDIFTSICSSNSYPTQISRTIKCAMKHTSYTYKFTTF